MSFKWCLGISLVIHAIILAALPALPAYRLNRSLKKLEITYYQLQHLSDGLQPKPSDLRISRKRDIREELGRMKKVLPVPAPQSQESSIRKTEVEQKPITVKQAALKKRITLPPVKSEKMKNPVYNNYYQIVREKIRSRAYNLYSQFETGDVYLTFVVTSDGRLKEVKLIEEKSPAGGYLKEIAIRSIRDSSPFPAFPGSLQFPELSFNVVISFEVND